MKIKNKIKSSNCKIKLIKFIHFNNELIIQRAQLNENLKKV